MISCSHWGLFPTDWPFTETGYRWNEKFQCYEYYREIQNSFD